MGKNHSSMVVLRIRPRFWWMLPMGVRDNHTKYGPETQRWRPGTGVAGAEPSCQNLQFGAKISLFSPKTALEPAKNGQMKGNSGYSRMQLDVLLPKGPPGPSNCTICPRTAPKKAQNLCTLAADSPKPKTDHILGYVAQNTISRAPNPPATTHLWWFPHLEISLTDA